MTYFLVFMAGAIVGALLLSVCIRAGLKKLVEDGTITLGPKT